MIEDIQTTVKMVQPTQNQQLQAASAAVERVQRRNGGGNMQLDNERKNKSIGVGSSRGSGKKIVKNYRQNQKRDQSFSKNTKKNFVVDSKKGHSYSSSDDIQSLINFQYAPVSRPFMGGGTHMHHGGRRKHNAAFNKEAFLQANCNFVVDESKKYAVNAIDPDVLVDWEDIQLVYLPTNDAPSCPICLYPPVAGKMTRCGHVFCWSCVLHYLKLGDKNWRKCPICHEAVHEKDLKSVVSCTRKKFGRLDRITMTLMKRSKDSLFAVPKDQWSSNTVSGFPKWTDDIQSGYKLALSSKQDVLNKVLLREQVELEVQLNQAILDETGEECFIQSALDQLQKTIKSLKDSIGDVEDVTIDNEEIKESSKSTSEDDHYLANLLASTDVDDECGAFTDDEELDEDESLSPVACAPEVINIEEESDVVEAVCGERNNDGMEVSRSTRGGHRNTLSESSTCSWDHGDHTHRSVLENQPTKDFAAYYFYQAADGQNIFIHSLNARCLIEEYASLADGPAQISGQIIDFECFTMTKELRKRYRYLSHLPLSCEFVIVELMLRPPVLSKHTIHNFMSEFKKRKDKRTKKLDDQKKFDRRAENLRNKQEGFHPIYYDDDEEDTIQLDLKDNIDFPQQFSSPETPVKETSLKSSSGANDSPPNNSQAGPSFAQIIQTQSAAVSQSTKKRETTGAWGKPKFEELFPTPPTERRLDGNDSDEGPDLVAPSYKDMFTAAMFTAPIKSTTDGKQKEEKKGGKKKKNKGTLLFGTGGQRKY